MFGFLKDKLKSALSVFSRKVDEESEEVKAVESLPEIVGQKEEQKAEIKEERKQKKEKEKAEKKEEKEEIKKIAEEKKEEKIKEKKEEEKVEKKEVKKKERKEEKKEEKVEKNKEEAREEKKEINAVEEKPVEIPVVEQNDVPEKKGFFASIKEKIITKTISAGQFDELFWALELVLMENNVAVSVIEKIKDDLRLALVGRPLPRLQVQDAVLSALKNSVLSLFEFRPFDFVGIAKSRKPFVVCVVGVNGSGKTTTIAKLVYLLQKSGLSCVIAAADTFRAAAIDQLQLHADKLGVKLIRQEYGADAAAVAFDAIKHAEAKGRDVVLVDTAGRLHSNVNLMEELRKIVRVARPNLKIFVGESIAGNDCVEQARLFDEAVGIDGIVLSKADVDEKGGAALSVSYVTKKPILYLGIGQEYDDLEVFDKEKMIKQLGL